MRDLSLYGTSTRNKKLNPPAVARPKAVIVDIDGTICDNRTALPYLFPEDGSGKDWDAFYKETSACPTFAVAIGWVGARFVEGYKLVVITGRSEKYRDLTVDWLNRNLTLPFDGPFMRSKGDYRPSDEMKRETYERLSSHYDFQRAIEDDPKVIELWKSLGLKVAVGPGRREWDNPKWASDPNEEVVQDDGKDTAAHQ